jgi:hypothetical protein
VSRWHMLLRSPHLQPPMVPLRAHLLGATMTFVTGGPSEGPNRETSPPFLVSKQYERTSGAVVAKRRLWSKLQVVPGSIVLKVDRLAGWPEQRASQRCARTFRVGKAGSVRMG